MRILVVEDEKYIAELIKNSLRAKYFAVDIADDGEMGSYLARINSYDAIVLDNVLPKRTGLQVCGDIRKEKISTPIIVLSATSETSAKIELLNAGADDYLTKPFSPDELIARIRALLRRPKNIEDDVFKNGELAVDLKNKIVMKSDREIHLTRKEFTLLEYLIRNRNAVVSRHMILEHVWDMRADPFTNTIEAHISSLRQKIDSESCERKKSMIRTVSGRGYKLNLV